MRKTFVIIIAVMFSAIASSVHGQVAPNTTGDKDLRDTNIKQRSVEMERIDRDSKKNPSKTENNPTVSQPPADPLAAKYEEIKTDYEQMQLSQDAVIKAYQSADKPDHAAIAKAASDIQARAARLKTNLFPPPAEADKIEKEDKAETAKESKKSIRDLIVELDNAVGRFVSSPMFQNLRVVDPKVAETALADLEKIIVLSENLESTVKQAASAGK